MRDTYAYDAQDRLTSYTGHDGFAQTYAYGSHGLRSSMAQKGAPNRLTLEEELLGKQLETEAAAPDTDEWIKTDYIQDITMPYGQVIAERTEHTTTSYTYGLERISALTSDGSKTQYVYDGRGSVAQTLVQLPGATKPIVDNHAYTPFGEMLSGKQTGFGFNAEWYDAATGMQNLRARQYEPAMNRFSQKDLLRESQWNPLSLNRYAYVLNNPVNLIDPSGMYATGSSMIGQGIQLVNTEAKRLAASASAATGKKKEQLANEWFEYCSKHYDLLRGDVKTQFDKAKKKLKNAGGENADEKERAAILIEACLAIVENEQKYSTMESAFVGGEMYFAGGVRELVYSGRYTLAEMEAFIKKYYQSNPAMMKQQLALLHEHYSSFQEDKVIGSSIFDLLGQGLVDLGISLGDVGYGILYDSAMRWRSLANSESVWEGTLNLLDFLTLGSLNNQAALEQKAKEEPSLYNIVNAITLGYLDTAQRALQVDDLTDINDWLAVVNFQLPIFTLWRLGLNNGSSVVTPEDVINQGTKQGAPSVGSTGKLPDEAFGSQVAEHETIIASEQKMWQLGDHYNKHGREMGYSSKNDYDAAAKDFVNTVQDSPDTIIFEGQWNGRGQLNGSTQTVITNGGRTAIIDSTTGQIIDFYVGDDYGGLINLQQLK